MSENQFTKLMQYVCVENGYCGCLINGKPSHVSYFIPDFGPVTSEQFAEWVMLADNVGPEDNPKFRDQHKNDIKRAFLQYMGADIVDAAALKWDTES